MDRLISLVGIFVLMGIAYLLSNNRKAIDWKLVGAGVGLQFVFAGLVLKTRVGQAFFAYMNDVIVALLGFTDRGSEFIFGFIVMDPAKYGEFVFAVKVLPTIIFFSALMSLLYYVGVMQFVVEIIAKVMVRLLGTSGAETLSASANIFIGQTEAPLLIKPYVEKMTRSELMVVMTGGFATVAGGVMAAYVALLRDQFPGIAGHLMAASLMSAPAALVMAKILIPETEEPMTKGDVKIDVPQTDANAIEAAANGASTGLQLALNVGAMLLAFIALINMFDAGLNLLLGHWIPDISFSMIFSYLFAPIALVMGVPSQDALVVGELLGKKLIINEFVAYLDLANILKGDHPLTGRSTVILTYALCGFANFSSIGIQIGGIGGIAPSRKGDLARLGVIAVIGGTLACFQTATIAGALIDESEIQLVRPAPTASPTPESTPEAGQPTPAESPTPVEATPAPEASLPSRHGIWETNCLVKTGRFVSYREGTSGPNLTYI